MNRRNLEFNLNQPILVRELNLAKLELRTIGPMKEDLQRVLHETTVYIPNSIRRSYIVSEYVWKKMEELKQSYMGTTMALNSMPEFYQFDNYSNG